MDLQKVLTQDSVRVGLAGRTKREIIEEMLDIIIVNCPDLNRKVLLAAVLDREAQKSTGMKNGIAIPHGKTDMVSTLHHAIGVSSEPVDFYSLDKCPARIFIMTVSPASMTGPHLQFLSEVSHLLAVEDFRSRVLAAESRETVLGLFLNATV